MTDRTESPWLCPDCETWVGWKRETCGNGHDCPRFPMRYCDVDFDVSWKVSRQDRLRGKLRSIQWTAVDRLVIRGDDPREPHASKSGMKLRALAVAAVPAIAALVLATALEAPDTISLFLPGALLVVAVKAVTGPINERIDALEDGGAANE